MEDGTSATSVARADGPDQGDGYRPGAAGTGIAPADIAPPNEIRIPRLRLRRFAGQADLEGMAQVLQAASRLDGLDWFPTAEDLSNELANAPNEQPTRDAVIAEVDGRIVGFARAGWAVRDGRHVYHTTGEVDPSVRRLGLGRALLHLEQARLREIGSAHVRDQAAVFGAEVQDGQDGALALLTADGYVPVRWFAEMERDLSEPIGARELPEGLEIRPVTDEDRRLIFAAEAEAFRDHWGHREWTDADFRWAWENPAIVPSLWRVAWAGEEVAGVVATHVYARENEALGIRRAWLERVSVRRPWRQQGVASALMTSAMLALQGLGFERALLGVDTENPSGAVGVYERLGFRRVKGGMIVERPFDPEF